MAAVDWKTKNRQSSEKAPGPEQPMQNPAPWTHSAHTKAFYRLETGPKEESWTARDCPAHLHLPLKVAERYLADSSQCYNFLRQLRKSHFSQQHEGLLAFSRLANFQQAGEDQEQWCRVPSGEAGCPALCHPLAGHGRKKV